MSKVFRASFSTLNAWASGDIDKAIRMYFHLEMPVTPQMDFGIKKHKEWEAEVNATKRVPEIFGGELITNPTTELKAEIMIEPWLQLVGRPDCVSDEYVDDFKTGASSSLNYINTMQLPIYQILCWSQKRMVKKGRILHFNQYTNTKTVSIKHLTKKTLEDGLNWLLTYGAEMHDYLTVHNLYKELGGKK